MPNPTGDCNSLHVCVGVYVCKCGYVYMCGYVYVGVYVGAERRLEVRLGWETRPGSGRAAAPAGLARPSLQR